MKIFEATMKEGVISADKGAVVECPVLGEGGNSEGFLIMAEGKMVYLPKTSPDLLKTLEYIANALNIIATGIFASNLGGAITIDSFASDIQAIKLQVEELKGKLK